MKKSYVIFGLIALFILTRKKYALKDWNIFIPNTSLLGAKSDSSIIDSVRKNLQFQVANGNLIISVKPVYGFNVPYYEELPVATLPLSIPQIAAQIGSNIRVEDVRKMGILLGKRLIIKGVTFYA